MQEEVGLTCVWGSDSKLGSQMLEGSIQSGTEDWMLWGLALWCNLSDVSCVSKLISKKPVQRGRTLSSPNLEDIQ